MNAKTFKFTNYTISEDRRKVAFNYQTVFEDNKSQKFTESLEFNERLPDNSEILDNALHFYHIVAGVSYYKAHLAPEIGSHGLDPWASETMNQIYREGYGEFLYMNKLDPEVIARFEPELEQQLPTTNSSVTRDDWLVPIGGGKDSLTTTTILDQMGQDYMTFMVNPKNWNLAQIDEIGRSKQLVIRTIDPFLTSNSTQYRGHVPITVVISAVAIITAVINGCQAVVFSNESSADEPTIDNYCGMAVNHQWAKSSEAEKLIQQWLTRYISKDLEYFSLLRNLDELQIADLFAKAVLPRYRGLWSSSNSNFRIGENKKLDWDLTSPKTCTVFLLLAPFVEREELIKEFGGNPFLIPENLENWSKLLGKTEAKPFECVATVDEMREALGQAMQNWPEAQQLAKELRVV